MLRASRTAPDAKSVHQLRTTIRRVQTLAATLGEQDEKAFAKFNKVLVEIFDRAGRVRDLDVQLDCLGTISLPSVEHDKAVLHNYLQRQRSKRGRKLGNLVSDELTGKLPRRQRKAKALLMNAIATPAAADRKTGVDLRHEVQLLIEKLNAPVLDTASLHALRLEVKHVRYTAEIAGESGAETIALLKPVQDAIGIWHDWINLINTADEVLGPLPGHPLMTILRSKVRGRFQNATAALKPLSAQLADSLQVGKRPGPVLVLNQQKAAAASAS